MGPDVADLVIVVERDRKCMLHIAFFGISGYIPLPPIRTRADRYTSVGSTAGGFWNVSLFEGDAVTLCPRATQLRRRVVIGFVV